MITRFRQTKRSLFIVRNITNLMVTVRVIFSLKMLPVSAIITKSTQPVQNPPFPYPSLSLSTSYFLHPSFSLLGSISPTFYLQLLRQKSCTSKVQTLSVSIKKLHSQLTYVKAARRTMVKLTPPLSRSTNYCLMLSLKRCNTHTWKSTKTVPCLMNIQLTITIDQ